MTSPPAFDAMGPDAARVYNHLRGGKDWLPPDRELAERLKAICPPITDMIGANEIYLGFAAMQARDAGVRQFLDLGGGFPAAGSVRDIAQARDPDARVVTVDWSDDVADPVTGYGPLLEYWGVTGAAVVQADIADPRKVLADPGLTGLIDLGEPVALIFGLVLHSMEPQRAREVVAGFVSEVAWGSLVAVTVARGCGDEAFGQARKEWEAGTGSHAEEFSLDDVTALLGGLEVRGEVGPVTGPRLAGPCVKPHIAGGIARKL